MADKSLFETVMARCMCGSRKHNHNGTEICGHCDNPCSGTSDTCFKCRRVEVAYTK